MIFQDVTKYLKVMEGELMKYAVFDWDNTVREGYTLFSWIDYLIEKEIVSEGLGQKEHDLGKRYKKQEITHDEYADIACRYYAQELAGINIRIIENNLPEYLKNDERNLFPFVNDLFRYLKMQDIKPIVISGAPQRIIDSYKNSLNLYEIYAVKEQEEGEFYTGELEYNYGHDKQRIIDSLIKQYGRPIFGFGDSSSDIPLLQEARHGVCVCDNSPKIRIDNMITIKNNESGNAVVSRLAQF